MVEEDDRSDNTSGKGVRRKVNSCPLISFCCLAYLLSWIIWIPLIFLRLDKSLTLIIMLIGVFGPMAAAIIVSRLTGTLRQFWKRILHWRVSVKWYLAALGIPLVILLLLQLLNAFWGMPEDGETVIRTIDALPWFFYPLILLFMIFLGGGLEEPGWRGFAQERMLKRFSPLVASLILGLIWTCWHAPLFFIPGTGQHGLNFGWYAGALIGLAMIYTWLFVKSKGSILPAIIFHGGFNAAGEWMPAFSVEAAGLIFKADSFAIPGAVILVFALAIFFSNTKLFLRRIDKIQYSP